ncbi:tetratricopeptide repeat protein [Ochrovirga pacifica]|uniref:tetratricopeptide repeat protein n=1 Tax=Ochrovirga pacifica TaxID=1042376 RepID=UPI00025591A4|nr:tetratricopeptide repeat protein [Ochrovirga pacifica]
MKKQLLIVFSFCAFAWSFVQAQNSYKENHIAKWYNKAIYAFDSENYALAAAYFDKVNVPDYKKSLVETYLLVIALELKKSDADAAAIAYLQTHPFSPNKNTLILALSNYYFDKGYEAKALKWFDQIDVKMLTSDQETNYNYKQAFANYKRKNYSKAKQYLIPMAQQGAYQKEATYYLGNIALENKDYATAKEYFDQIQDQRQYQKEINFNNLVILYHQKKYKEAIELGAKNFERARGLEQSQMAKIIGESYFYLGDYQQAISYLLQYRGKLKQGLTEVDYYFLGYAYYKTQDYDKAIENFNKITDQKTAVSQNAHYHLGDCYLKKNQKAQALNAFKNASEMDFDAQIQQDAFLNYAKLSYDIGNPYQSSSEVLQAYVDAYPNSKATSYIEKLIVNAYLQFKDYQGAIDYYQKQRLIKDELYQTLLLEKGFEYFNNRKYTEASRLFAEASRIYASDELKNRALFWKAESLSELNDFQSALYDYQSFVQHDANKMLEEYPDAVYGLAYAYYQQKQYENAIRIFQEYVQLANNNVKRRNAILRIADCYFVSKSYWPALENYNQIINENKEEVDYALYQKALGYGFLSRNDKKIETLKALQNQFTRSPYLDDSYYQLGNLYVNQNKNNLAIAAYNDLIQKYSKSPLVAKAKLKKGTVLFNTGANQKAIAVLKELVASYPGTAEAIQAVKIGEQVYKDMGQVEAYAAWVKELEFVNITDADIDKTMFETVENKFLTNDMGGTISNAKKYLINFPNGIYALTVHFYLAQAYYAIDAKDRAVPEYQEVLKVKNSEYTEVALSRLSQIYLENEQWEQASPLLQLIETQAVNAQSIVYAQSNLMKYYYKKENHEKVLSYTEKVLNAKQSSKEAIADAYVFGARSSVALKDYSKAKTYYAKLETTGKGEIQAEANYYKAFWLHQDKKYEASNKQIQLLASKFQKYKYWGVKGLLLMAQNFHELEDDFQANFILNNVVKNAKQYPEVIAKAQELLKDYAPKNQTEKASTIKNVKNAADEF